MITTITGEVLNATQQLACITVHRDTGPGIVFDVRQR